MLFDVLLVKVMDLGFRGFAILGYGGLGVVQFSKSANHGWENIGLCT